MPSIRRGIPSWVPPRLDPIPSSGSKPSEGEQSECGLHDDKDSNEELGIQKSSVCSIDPTERAYRKNRSERVLSMRCRIV